MDILRVYFNGDDGKAKEFEFAMPSWYHKPKIISAVAFQLQYYLNRKFLFATSTKYGCSQFPVIQSKAFPVHNLLFAYYKKGLPWLTPEFNDCASHVVFEPRKFFKFNDILKNEFPEYCIDKINPYTPKMPF